MATFPLGALIPPRDVGVNVVVGRLLFEEVHAPWGGQAGRSGTFDPGGGGLGFEVGRAITPPTAKGAGA